MAEKGSSLRESESGMYRAFQAIDSDFEQSKGTALRAEIGEEILQAQPDAKLLPMLRRYV